MHPPLRDATIAYFCVVESTSGDLAGYFALTHTEAFAPPPRQSRLARRAAPDSEGPIATLQPVPEGRGSKRILCVWRRPASPRWRGRGYRYSARARALRRCRARNTDIAQNRGPRVSRSRRPRRRHRTGPVDTARGTSRAAF